MAQTPRALTLAFLATAGLAAVPLQGEPGLSWEVPDAHFTVHRSKKSPPSFTDLSGQWADPPTRDQKDVAACHVFSAVALLEAAYFRKYREHVHLSEADLFISVVLEDPARLLRPYLDGLRKAQADVGEDIVEEEGEGREDIYRALRQGVAAESALPWDQFYERYNTWYQSFAAAARNRAARPRSAAEGKALARLIVTEAVPFKREDFEGGRGLEIADSRRVVAGRLEGFRLAPPRDFEVGGSGAAQRAEILKWVRDRGIPVLVSMVRGKSASWGPGHDDEHSFVISGARVEWGRTSFWIRNSEGDANPILRGDEAGQIEEVLAVLTPEEAAAFLKARPR